MKQGNKKTKHITTRTVWLSVLSSIAVGLASLLFGLGIYGNSLMRESITRARATTSRAASSAQHGADTAGLAKDVMTLYESLTDEQRSMTGTEEYRRIFESLESVSGSGKARDTLVNLLRNYMADVTRGYVCAFDAERGVMVYLADSDRKNPHFSGEWEPAPEGWIEELTEFKDYEWNGSNTPYIIKRSENGDRICVTAYPIKDAEKQTCAYLTAEISINNIITDIVKYALKVSAVVLGITLIVSVFVGLRMKKTVADPINTIADTAAAYVQDRKNGIYKTDHFSSLGMPTGDELENLTDVMGDMEKELIEHENQIEALLDSLVKALSIAIDDRSHYTGRHTQNMAKMAESFLDWMQANGNSWHYDETKRRVFIMSVGLHDIGKLTVPLEIMDKSTRLGPGLQTVADRFARMKLIDRVEYLEGRISEADYETKVRETNDTLAFIEKTNSAGYLSDEDLERIKALADMTYTDENGVICNLLTEDEIKKLSIRKGTLTEEERSVMQSHATSTWHILKQVDFPAQYAYVPIWAASHHELLRGNGYPNGIGGEKIPKEVRLLTILDIFEALTAKDRPYKPSFPLEKAWSILDSMVKEGSLDGELLAEFKESRAWETVLSPDRDNQ